MTARFLQLVLFVRRKRDGIRDVDVESSNRGAAVGTGRALAVGRVKALIYRFFADGVRRSADGFRHVSCSPGSVNPLFTVVGPEEIADPCTTIVEADNDEPSIVGYAGVARFGS